MAGTAVGFIGLGAMGSRMAANLAAAGFDLVCYDAAGTAERAPEGARCAGSVAEVAAGAEVVLLSLPDGRAVASVAEEMLATNDRKVASVLDTSTIGVRAARAAHEQFAGGRIAYLDAPVSGGIAGAAAATIALMFAGPREAYERLAPVIGAVSRKPFYIGAEPGQGQAMKLANNFLSGMAMTATSEAISFGLTQGLDPQMMIEVLNASSGQNTATSDKFPNRILNGRYDASFLNTLYLKDLTLYVENVQAAGAPDLLSRTLLPVWQRFTESEPGVDFTRIYPFVRDKK
ncbi:MAG TPA: NAD(P)-dependent oxidoreductase [Alphaproteobacteria bacterium]|nr:NAD(P)-dependent oxidoreductase [Alphaproteobacteria bacterium]